VNQRIQWIALFFEIKKKGLETDMSTNAVIKKSAGGKNGLSSSEKGILLKASLLKGLSPELQRELIQTGAAHTMRRGGFLFTDGDPVTSVSYILVGRLQEYHISEAGEVCLRRILQPESFVSLHLFFRRQPTYTFNCEAITEVRYFSWNSRSFQKLVMQHPALGLQAAGILSDHVEKICRLNCLCRKPHATARVAGYLLRRCRAQASGDTDTTPLRVNFRPLGLTANNICLARETLSRALSSLQDQGAIRIKNSIVEILDLDILKKISGIL
jgi:CRP-like cAMP-binding protein